MKKNLLIFFAVAYLFVPCRSAASQDGICTYASWYEIAVDCKMVTDFSPELHAHIATLTTGLWYNGLAFRSGNITQLSWSTFYGYDGINKLRLEDDNIERIAPGAFEGLRNLTELYVVKNKITVVESNFFSEDLAKLLVLDLSNNLIAHIAPNAFAVLKSLRKIILDGNDLDTLPEKVFSGTNLSTLSVARNRLRYFEPGFFKTMPHLQVLIASSNVLGGIMPNDFATNAKLERVELQNNYLVTVQNLSMPTVKFLNLSSNHLVSLIYANFTSVQTLDLSDNLISTLNTTTFGSLRELIMKGNVMSDTHAFETTITSLNELTLSYNNLRSFNTSVFKNHGLRKLDLSGNYLTDLGINPVNYYLALQLILQHNKLTTFNVTTSGARFYGLDLSHNEFAAISFDFFNRIILTWSLDMSHNQIAHIAVGAFRNQWRLRFLDLSHNNIQTLGSGVFQGMNAMNLVNISHNLLTKVNVGLFHHYHVLMELDLSYNNIRVENLESVINRVSKVFLDHNNLTCSYLYRFDSHQGIMFGPVNEGTSHHVTNYRGNACIQPKRPKINHYIDKEMSDKMRVKAMLVLSIFVVIFTNILLGCTYRRILIRKYNQYRLFVNNPTASRVTSAASSFENLRIAFW